MVPVPDGIVNFKYAVLTGPDCCTFRSVSLNGVVPSIYASSEGEIVVPLLLVVLLTVTFTPPLVVLFPTASYARAVSVYDPFDTPVVSQDTEYGDVLSDPINVDPR